MRPWEDLREGSYQGPFVPTVQRQRGFDLGISWLMT